MRVQGTFLTLAALIMAGCTGGGAVTEEAEPNSTVIAASGEALPDAGAISGTVVDDSTMPIQGVTILVKELELGATTDEGGHFLIQNVAPGRYTIYAVKLGYDSVGKGVEVLATETAQITLNLVALSVAEAYVETQLRTVEILLGLSWSVGGDFNNGCIVPGVTCQGAALSSLPANGPNFVFVIDDPKQAPVATIILEQQWLPNSAVCAKAINVGLYNPKAPSTANPSSTNPHYWTNEPHPEWKITSPIWMRIPRNETGNPDAIDDPTRVERYLKEDKDDRLPVKGNWTVRDFPPGKGLTNQAADVNCFTQQKIEIFWTTFFLDPSPIDFSARPDA